MSTLAHEAPVSGLSRVAGRFRPAFILWRHVIQEMIAPTLLGFGVFTFLMLMRFLLRISQIWIQYGAELATVLWAIVYLTLFRLSPRTFHRWRAFLLRRFGARVSMKAKVYPRARIWAPWNLSMADYSTLADHVDCYCADSITIVAD